MATKTEEYLRILAEGGDAPTDCCMTNTQALIAQAIERINNLSGVIEPLDKYINEQGTAVTDIDGLISAIEDGKGFYLDSEGVSAGMPITGGGVMDGLVTDTEIILIGKPSIQQAYPGVWTLVAAIFRFDKTTGQRDTTASDNIIVYQFGQAATAPGQPITVLANATLTINVGGTTYIYDGTRDVTINIS